MNSFASTDKSKNSEDIFRQCLLISRIWIPDSNNLHNGPVTNLLIKPRALQPHK